MGKDIVIYMNERDFKHKTSECGGQYFWSMNRIPKYFTEGNNIWIACKRYVQGFVPCLEFNPKDKGGETIVWDSDDWTAIPKLIPCKPFRGFRYRWFLKEA